jgi:hypothetical protein
MSWFFLVCDEYDVTSCLPAGRRVLIAAHRSSSAAAVSGGIDGVRRKGRCSITEASSDPMILEYHLM